MTRKEQLEKKIKEGKDELKKAQAELSKIQRAERREAEKRERERAAAQRKAEIDEFTEICDKAKTLPSGTDGVDMYEDFKRTVNGLARRRAGAATRGEGGE